MRACYTHYCLYGWTGQARALVITAIEPLLLTDAFFSTVPFCRLALAEDPDTEIIVLDTPPPDKPGGVPCVDSVEVRKRCLLRTFLHIIWATAVSAHRPPSLPVQGCGPSQLQRLFPSDNHVLHVHSVRSHGVYVITVTMIVIMMAFGADRWRFKLLLGCTASVQQIGRV